VLGNRADDVFLTLQALLAPGGSTRYNTDKGGAYRRYLPMRTVSRQAITQPYRAVKARIVNPYRMAPVI